MALGGALDFVIGLEDKVSPAAKAASSALAQLQTELSGAKSKLALYQQQLSIANERGDIEGHRRYTALVQQAQAETYRLGEAMVAGQHNAVGFGAEMSALGSEFGGFATAAVAAIAAVGVSLADLVLKAVETAIEVTDANERLIASFEALGGAGAGEKTLKFLNELSSELPQSRDQLAKWAKQYEAMGVTDLGELRGEIRATAAAQAIMGDEGASAYEMLTRKVRVAIEEHKGLKLPEKGLANLYKAGINVTDMAQRLGMSTTELGAKLKSGAIDADKFGAAMRATLEAKGARPLEDLSNDLDTLKVKGLEAFHHLFDGIDTSPISDALKQLLLIGDLGSPTGAMMADGIRSGVQLVIDYMGQMMTEGEIIFLKLNHLAFTHRRSLALIADGFSQVGHSILLATNMLEDLLTIAAAPPPAWLVKLLGATNFAGSFGGGGHAPAHAEGGLVSKPAPGEYFASVAPGEMILPKDNAREILGGGIGPRGREMVAANTNGQPAGGVQIHHLELTIEAKDGVTDATSLSATGLALALERMQLASGR